MKASKLWEVWNNLNLWPWLTLFFGGVCTLIFYSLSNADGKSGTDLTTQSEEALKKVNEELKKEVDLLNKSYHSASRSLTISDAGSSGKPSSQKAWVTVRSNSTTSADQGFKGLAGGQSGSTISTGSVIRAQLIMPIKTSVQERFVMAQTTHEFRDPSRAHLRIPVGTRLIGRAQMNTALRSVDVRFTTLVSPNGREYPAQLLALSKSLFAELNGIFFSNDLETYSSVMAFGFIEGFSQAAKERETTIIGQIAKDNLTNKTLDGVGSASFRVAEEMIKDIREKSVEYIVVPSGEEIYAVFTDKFTVPGGKSLE